MKFLENGDPNPTYRWSKEEMDALGKRALQRLHYSMLGKRTGQGEAAESVIARIVDFVASRDEQRNHALAEEFCNSNEKHLRYRTERSDEGGLTIQAGARIVPPLPSSYIRETIPERDKLMEILARVEQKLDILIKVSMQTQKKEIDVKIPDDAKLKKMEEEDMILLCEHHGINTNITGRRAAKSYMMRALSKIRSRADEIREIMTVYNLDRETASQAHAINDTTGTPIATAVEMVRT